MKTIVINVKSPAPNDTIYISYYDPRGGRTDANYRILGQRLRPIADEHGIVTKTETIPADTPIDIHKALVGAIKRNWMEEAFKAKIKEDTGALVINCADTVDRVRFDYHVDGGGGTEVSMDVF